VREAVVHGKLVVIATEVLESMIENPRPSRSDIVDLYNSVRDLVDAVLFTSETAIGKYPVEVVKWAKRIIETAESKLPRALVAELRRNIEPSDLFDKYIQGLVLLAESLDGVIVGYSRTGRMPARLSKYRPQTRIYIGVGDRQLAERLVLRYGVEVRDMTSELQEGGDYEKGVSRLKELLVKENRLRPGNIVVETYAKPQMNIHEIRISQLT